MKKYLSVLLLAALILSLTACQGTDRTSSSESPSASDTQNIGSSALQTTAQSGVGDVTATIIANGTDVTIDGKNITAINGVVTISAAGTYELKGTLDGQILVDADKDSEVILLLAGIDVKCSGSAPIYAKQGNVTVELKENSENSLYDNGEYTYETDTDEPSAALFVKDDLTITGLGSLKINAGFNDGITCKDNLTILSGVIDITAADDGIVGRDNTSITGGNITIEAGGDGVKTTNDTDAAKGNVAITGGSVTIKATDKGLNAMTDIMISGGEITIDSTDDAVHANGGASISGGNLTLASGDDGIHADGALTISGGDIAVTKSYEGIEGATIDITDGTVNIVSTDDGINAAGGSDGTVVGRPSQQDPFSAMSAYYIKISGGIINVNAGSDGIDSNGNIYFEGGEVYVDGPTNSGNGAIDFDRECTISGGTLIAVGAAGMAAFPGEASTQNVLVITFDQTLNAGTEITVKDATGNTVISYTPAKTFQSVIMSTDKLNTGESYNVYQNGENFAQVTISSTVTTAGSNIGMGGMGGFAGMGGQPGSYGNMGNKPTGGRTF